MMLKTGLLALIVMMAMTAAATAECHIRGPFGFPRQQGPTFTTGVTYGSPCVMDFRSIARGLVISASIAARPAHGTLSQVGTMQFRYQPRPGFQGVDGYTLHVCTKRPGCWNLHYSINVNVQ